MGMHVAASVKAHPAGAADRRLNISAGKADAACGQTVKVRGLHRGVTGAGQVVMAQLVIHDEEDVLDLGHGLAFNVP